MSCAMSHSYLFVVACANSALQKSANKNGALTDSRIGPAVSKRLYKVFMGLNPSSTDV